MKRIMTNIGFLIGALAFVPVLALAGPVVYCPQQITCHVNSGGGITGCSNLPSGWQSFATITNGVNFREGDYVMSFSFATVTDNVSASCYYVVNSTDTYGVMIDGAAGNWRANTTVANKWQRNDYNHYYYCYASGLWYDTINDASGCPFDQ